MFHNTTAKYNGFYYANEAHREADLKLQEIHEERWDEMLPCFWKRMKPQPSKSSP